ncbi:MAG: hypothetical protein ACM3SY_21575 [Candidatus Omnitrophota bacterium]
MKVNINVKRTFKINGKEYNSVEGRLNISLCDRESTNRSPGDANFSHDTINHTRGSSNFSYGNSNFSPGSTNFWDGNTNHVT